MPVKSQSAIEYLMTYGWAILIIAIVMVAMFQLGIFNTSNPRVSAGACEVYRSAATSPTLTGECQGVWPQFVAQFNGASYVNVVGVSRMPKNALTITAWINPTSGNNWYRNIVATNCFRFELTSAGYPPNYGLDFEIASACGRGGDSSSAISSVNTYTFIAVTFNGVASQFYTNGAAVGSPFSINRNSNSITAMYIGKDGLSGIGGTDNMYGNIANVQIYNTSLSGPEVTALYQEGIGGAPIDPTNIVGWWPLNGNAQDYSGNGNNGQATGVTYTSAWTSGYTQP